MSSDQNASADNTAMEGINTEVNRLKRRNSNTEVPIGIAEIEINTTAPKRKQGGSGDGTVELPPPPPTPPLATGLSLEDLMKEIRSVGRDVACLRQESHVTKELLAKTGSDVQKFQERVDKVENIAQEAADLAINTRSEVRQMKEEIKLELNNIRATTQNNVRAAVPQAITNEMRRLRIELERQEGFSRRYNLIISGIPEPTDETTEALNGKVDSFIRNILGISSVRFDICHRLGAARLQLERKVIVKFRSLEDKNLIWEARTRLKNSRNHRLVQDKPRSLREREAISLRIVHKAKESGRFRYVKYVGGKVWLDDKSFEYEDFGTLPFELRPEYISSPRSNTALAFFSAHSPLSNHYKVNFELDGVSFSSMEQYLARARALMAKDLRMAKKIMQTDDPVKHKGFLNSMKDDGKDEMWRAAIDTWLDPGLEAKFAQNPQEQDFLLDTKDLQLGEASRDVFWGIGMELSHPHVLRPELWANGNTLGKALMKLRGKIAGN